MEISLESQAKEFELYLENVGAIDGLLAGEWLDKIYI